MKMRQQRFPVVGDRRHRAADVRFFEGRILGLGQAADGSHDELVAPLEGPMRGLFARREPGPLGIGQIPRSRRQADMHRPLGVAAGGALLLTPAAAGQHMADRRVRLGFDVVHEVDDGDAALHQ